MRGGKEESERMGMEPGGCEEGRVDLELGALRFLIRSVLWVNRVCTRSKGYSVQHQEAAINKEESIPLFSRGAL